MTPRRAVLIMTTIVVVEWVTRRPAGAQELGHKIPGTVGIHAGDQPGEGLSFADRLARYSADQARDRNGIALPLPGFDLDAVAGVFGIGAGVRLASHGPYLGVAIGVPVAHVSLNIDRPEVSVDRFGLGDLYVQPIRLGWKFPRLEFGTSYAFYAPTGWYDPAGRRGVGAGQWSHEMTLGGTVFFDRARTVFVSALSSVIINQQKQGIEITRGATMQIQGGIGVRLFRFVDVGLAGYALWQIADDTGTALPNALRGARDQVYGVGPEIGILIAPIHAQLSVRYEHDFGVRARPDGQLLACTLSWRAWNSVKPEHRS